MTFMKCQSERWCTALKVWFTAEQASLIINIVKVKERTYIQRINVPQTESINITVTITLNVDEIYNI